MLHVPWPHEQVAVEEQMAATQEMVSSQPTALLPSSSFLTPAKHVSFLRGRSVGPAAPVADLSQNMDFLMSQGSEFDPTQRLRMDDAEEGEEEDKNKMRMQHELTTTSDERAQDAEGNAAAAAAIAEAAAPPPADPHGVRDMLSGMGESWRQLEDMLQTATAQRTSDRTPSALLPTSSTAAAAAGLAARESALSDWNADLFRGWLISHELLPDPKALAAEAAQIAEDMGGAVADLMAEEADRDDD